MTVELEQLIIGTPKVSVTIKPSLDMKCSKCGRRLFPEDGDDYVRLQFDDSVPINQMPLKVCCICKAEHGYPWGVISFLSFIEII